MEAQVLQLEKKYLLISVCGNIVVATVGLIIAAISSSQAILLDGLFNLTYFATGLFTMKVATLVAGGDDERYPHGYAFFEPLVNGIKGMLVLGVSVMALAGAIDALLTGGRPIAAGVAIAYGIFASVTCWTVAMLTRQGAQLTKSPLVQADAENWIVNAAISSCVLLAFVGIFVLRAMDMERLAPYVDPIVVLLVVVVSIGVPVRMAWTALLALLNRAPPEEIGRQVAEIVDTVIADLPVQERFIRVIQPGRQRLVLVHVVLPPEYKPTDLSAFDSIREAMQKALSQAHVATIVDLIFTADRRWGAPLADGGVGGPIS